ncbi:SGNH/GDSL hydrolase family protein [Paenibacillus tepidiphilus]|uniref:SGNH/GDSL hydrolase family protein n=1 Tax=Paenibacillus tepidiphilus TaxID=2608683 RepID=UPI0013A589ED|nr:SGNH/GDSL hydrolase family protein [Paenibacillus tepidiphilus]
MNALFDDTFSKLRKDSAGPVILFLGDSITADGSYIRFASDWLQSRRPDQPVRLIARGVPSETVSGLSEAAHPFPRPCVHDRLAEELASAAPDIVVACYGMNDGIYHPYGEERFAAYRAGMQRLSEQIAAAGARTVLLAPPPFDAASFTGPLLPEAAPDFSYLTPYREYNQVLKRYADWLLTGSCPADFVIDMHSPLLEHIRRQRMLDTGYRYGDGIHPDASGHAAMARTLLRELLGAEAGELENVGNAGNAGNAD